LSPTRQGNQGINRIVTGLSLAANPGAARLASFSEISARVLKITVTV
jgi:hypothetical protein